MFCVKCGKEGRGTINGLCVDCFLDGREMVALPQYIDLERCTNCEEFLIGGSWMEMELYKAAEETVIAGMAVIREADVTDVGINFEKLDERNFLMTAEVYTNTKGYASVDTASTTVRLKNTVCRRCSRQLGNYYESTLQIRGGSRDLDDDMRDEIVRRVRNDVEGASKNNRQLFITKVEEVAGGVDILLSSISAGRTLARDIADRYGGEYKESSKLVGKTDDGRDMYRLTYLVRLPDYSVGDIVRSGGILYKLTWIGKNGGKLTDLRNFRETTIKRSDLVSVRVEKTEDDLREVTVVSVSKGEIQILHPTNYSTVDIRVPEDAVIGETVRVAVTDEEIFFIP